MSSNKKTTHRRELRQRSTKPESLLWSVIRNRKLNGLKFRRQHSVDPYIIDFACIKEWIAVELDGEYHDLVYEQDMARQKYLESLGWRVIRFSNEDVLDNLEGVTVSIRRFVNANGPYELRSRLDDGEFLSGAAPSP